MILKGTQDTKVLSICLTSGDSRFPDYEVHTTEVAGGRHLVTVLSIKWGRRGGYRVRRLASEIVQRDTQVEYIFAAFEAVAGKLPDRFSIPTRTVREILRAGKANSCYRDEAREFGLGFGGRLREEAQEAAA